jgi:hypothetical protein
MQPWRKRTGATADFAVAAPSQWHGRDIHISQQLPKNATRRGFSVITAAAMPSARSFSLGGTPISFSRRNSFELRFVRLGGDANLRNAKDQEQRG